MKKILIIHNRYRFLGGEDIAVKNEVQLLREKYEVKVLYFENHILDNYELLTQFFYFLFNRNYKSRKILNEALENFRPDYAYVHNTWFKASPIIFSELQKRNIPTVLKLHNFRYNCTKYLFMKNHLNRNKFCSACGAENNIFLLNNYFKGSILKSLAVIIYGKKYIKIIKNNNLKILVLTYFHKDFLINLGIDASRVHVLHNYLSIDSAPNTKNYHHNNIIYAGRVSKEKGVENLIESFINSNLEKMTLKILGSGPDLKYLENKYSSQKNVLFLGQVSNKLAIKEIHKSSAVVTATKLLEGQPTLLCEASYSGIPSIFPDTGGIREFFPGTTKLSFTQFDYEELTEKMKLLSSSNLRKKEGLDNKKFIQSLLNKENLFKEFEKVFNE
jgi:glycosyltransferase involved in cell wall biosynthesis